VKPAKKEEKIPNTYKKRAEELVSKYEK